jgi:predicted  nucleic acid-binding Zn-ribbon protein
MDRTDEITRQQIETRLAALKCEYDKGQAARQELEQQLTSLRETILRISGAIHVLEELLSSSASGMPAEQQSGPNSARTVAHSGGQGV